MAGGGELELAEEDVLRFLAERGGSAGVEEVAEEVGDRELAGRVVERLSSRGLLRLEGGRLVLTGEGRRLASGLLRVHREAEELASRFMPSRGHLVAHSVEHFPESLRVLEAIRPSRVVPLSLLPPGGSGYVVAVGDPRPRLLARLVGVGVVPGRRIRVVARLPSVLVVEVGASGRVAALDRDLAGRVLVAPVGVVGGGGEEDTAGGAAERGEE